MQVWPVQCAEVTLINYSFLKSTRISKWKLHKRWEVNLRKERLNLKLLANGSQTSVLSNSLLVTHMKKSRTRSHQVQILRQQTLIDGACLCHWAMKLNRLPSSSSQWLTIFILRSGKTRLRCQKHHFYYLVSDGATSMSRWMLNSNLQLDSAPKD